MVFDIQNMITTIKKIDGINISNEDILGAFFDPIIKCKCLKKNGKYICFDKTRASKVMNHVETIYISLSKTAFNEDTKGILLKKMDEIIHYVLDGVDYKLIIDALISLMNSDEHFDTTLKKAINSGRLNNNEIFVEFLIYVLKIEHTRYGNKDRFSKNGKLISKRTNISVIGRIIEEIILNGNKTNKEVNHLRAWTIEEKLTRNKINYILQMSIKNAFSEYESVMIALDSLSENDILTPKYLYSYYEKTYVNVVLEMFGDNISEERIISKSSDIFIRVDDYIYNELFSIKKMGIEYEILRYNLFALTVTVFYQCKFLLSMEE